MAATTQKFEPVQDSVPDRTAQALLNLRCAVDHCHDAVFITDPNGNIEFVNPAFEAMTGYSAQEAMGGSVGLIMPSDHSETPPFTSVLTEVLEKGIHRSTLRAQRKDGRAIEIDLVMAAVRDYRSRAAASVVSTARDVTDESELQAELRDARRMDTIGTVASGVAHDFNNLLMVISAYAELGLQTLYCDHPLRRNLQEILLASRSAADLTRQLLASGRSHVPGLQTVNLNSIVEDTCRLLPRVLGEDVELRVSLGENVGCVKANTGQMERVLLNLAVNARDAMPGSGTLTISTKSVVPQEIGSPDTALTEYVLLQVADTGEGIATDDVPKIFRPFYTTKSDGKGNGLGLAMVERTIRQNGGFIRVESEHGQGTAFHIYLPVAGQVQENSKKPRLAEGAVPLGSETILVVDDDAVRESNSEFLSSAGYQVLVGASAEEAIAMAARHPGKIDLMISDVVMPHMNGAKLASAMAESQPDLKVLFVSGHSESVVRRKGVGAEAQFLQKPYAFALLAARLREVLKPTSQEYATTAAAAAGAR
jgi:PAS domain S-box-containing protein